MHSIIIARRKKYFNPAIGSSIKTEYIELEDLDDDEFDLDDELNKLMDMLNDEQDPAIQEFARNRCKFLGWNVEQIYEPSDYYANDSGYVWCINIQRIKGINMIINKIYDEDRKEEINTQSWVMVEEGIRDYTWAKIKNGKVHVIYAYYDEDGFFSRRVYIGNTYDEALCNGEVLSHWETFEPNFDDNWEDQLWISGMIS